MRKAVLLTTFNRPDVTMKVFEEIKKAKPRRLYISSDGPRIDKEGEKKKILDLRKKLVNAVDWECEVKTLFRDENLGCRKAMSGAITWFFENEEDGIILEDDCVPNQSFFKFCEELLDYYKDDKRIMHISGTQMISDFKNDASYYFAKIQHCWGWASWADRWQYYGTDLKDYSEENLKKFSKNKNVQNYWGSILKRMQNNEIDSWAYQWTFKIVEKEGLCINPSVNLVSNIGFGEDSTHTTQRNNPFASMEVFDIGEITHPKNIHINKKAVEWIYKKHFGINTNTEQMEIQKLKERQFKLEKELKSIYNSRTWKIVVKCRKIFSQLFPKKSLRRSILKFILNRLKSLKKIYNCIHIGVKNMYYKIKPKKKRNINKKSKKIVYIGHSYHAKTRSTGFLIDYLKENFEVEEILNEQWKGKSLPDLSFIDDSYLGVIFFQALPPRDQLEKIKNENIIYIPMNDQSGRLGFEYWNQIKDLRIINFSSTLDKKLKNWGLETIYIQYFPEVKDFIPGNKDSIFFWTRRNDINIKMIFKLFKKNSVKIHLHKAVDPGHEQEDIKLSQKDKRNYSITQSTWFNTREEMLDVVKQRAIYIAPRKYEGIGLSFLEAMAMGKAIVAANNPTMNEYIKHNENGYLFEVENLTELDTSNIDTIQWNAYCYMKKGRKRWLKNRYNIIRFIRGERLKNNI